MFSSLQSYDRIIFNIINGFHWPDWFFSLLSVLGQANHWIAPIAITFLVIASLGNQKERVYVVTALITLALTSLIISDLLKPLIARIRPCHVIESVQLLGGCTKSFSMPSEHSTNVFAQATVLGLFYSRVKWISFPIAGFVGLSRIVHGKHYPADVLAGAVVGILLGLTVVYLFQSGLRTLDRNLFRGWTRKDSILRHKEWKLGSPGFLTFIILTFGTGARVVYAYLADLSPQEAIYWERSRSAATWDWLTHSPLETLANIGTYFFGETELGVRFGALLLSLLTSVILYFWARRIFPWSKWAAPIATIGLLATPIFGLGGARLSNTTALLTLWTSAFALADVAIRSRNEKNSTIWIIWGICVGVASWISPSALLLLPLTGLYLAFSPNGRRQFYRLAFYIGMIIGIFLIIIPLIAEVNTPTQNTEIIQLGGMEIDWLKTIAFWPVVHITLPLAILILWGVFSIAWSGRRKEQRASYAPLAWIACVLGTIAIAFHLFGVIQIEWASGWILGWICFVGAMSDILHRRNYQSLRLIKVVGLVIFIGFLQTTFILNIGLLRKLEIKWLPATDPSAQVIGWQVLGERVSRSLKQMRRETILLTTDPKTAAELSFYTRPTGEPLASQKIQRILPEKNSDSLRWSLQNENRRQDGLLVMVGKWEQPPNFLLTHYSTWQREDIFHIERERTTGTIRFVTLFRLRGDKPSGVAKQQEINR